VIEAGRDGGVWIRVYIEITFREVKELMQIAEEYDKAYYQSPERFRELENKLSEYERKFGMHIFFNENPGEYPAIIVDPENVFIDVSRDIIIRIARDKVTISADVKY
jgi:hypothetical protein